jgi:hypothetical protein
VGDRVKRLRAAAQADGEQVDRPGFRQAGQQRRELADGGAVVPVDQLPQRPAEHLFHPGADDRLGVGARLADRQLRPAQHEQHAVRLDHAGGVNRFAVTRR